ncbi:monooxygenase 2-like [Carex rostrata]
MKYTLLFGVKKDATLELNLLSGSWSGMRNEEESAKAQHVIHCKLRQQYLEAISKVLRLKNENIRFLEKDISTNPELLWEEVEKNLARDLPSEFLAVVKETDISTLSWVLLLFRAPWNIAFCKAQNGCVTIAGDAVHPMTPDLAQGGCFALEDAVILARCISQAHPMAKNDKQWLEKALKRYVEERRWRVTWLVAGAWLAGWVQQGGGGDQQWWLGIARWFRDRFCYQFIWPRTGSTINFDTINLYTRDSI